MAVEISGDMVGLDVASAELDKLVAADAQQSAESPAQTSTTDQSASDGQRAAQPEKSDSNPSPKETGQDQRTNEPKDQGKETAQPPKPGEPKATDQKPQSRYAKATERREKSWDELNRQKEEFQKQKAELDKGRQELEKQRAEFEEGRRKELARYTPEQYEKAAEAFEKQGKFDMAELARERAAELRKNPPPSPQQQDTARKQQEQHQAAMKEWWGKAAVDFPNVVKDGTPEKDALKTFIESEPEALRSPKGMYYAARLVSAEAAAGRLPGLNKELGELRARVKELEALTGPSPEAIPGRLPGNANEARSEAEQLADLERMAVEMGPLR